jgi:hypothetical protein
MNRCPAGSRGAGFLIPADLLIEYWNRNVRKRIKMIKKKVLILAIALTLSAFGCAKQIKKEAKPEISQETSTVKFWGYKVTVLVKATPEQLENYLTDSDKLKQEVSKGIKLERVSGGRMATVGDHADYVIKAAGFTVPYRLTMINYQPGEEIWYISETVDEFVVSVLRYQMKKVKHGTMLTVRFELQEPKGAILGPFSEAINLQEQMVKGTEHGVAMIQEYFDKSVNAEQLMAGGLRGDYYITFFTNISTGAFIEATPAKVQKYTASPDTWDKWDKDFKVKGITRCLIGKQAGACPAQVNLMGVDYKLNFFNATYVPEKISSGYFTSAVGGVGRVQTFIKPRNGGTDFSIEYMMQLSQFSSEGTEFLINLSQMPKIVEEMTLDIKTGSESKAK